MSISLLSSASKHARRVTRAGNLLSSSTTTTPTTTAAATQQCIHCLSSSQHQKQQQRQLSTSSSVSSPSTTTTATSNLVRPIRLSARPGASSSDQQLSKKDRRNNPLLERQRLRNLNRVYALTAPPPVSQLAALGDRIAPDLLGSRATATAATGTTLLEKLEQCCTCKSFWNLVGEEEEKERLTAQSIGASGTEVVAEKPAYTNFLDVDRRDNESLSVLGNHLLGVFALEWLESRYPHLPSQYVVSFHPYKKAVNAIY